MTNNPPPAKIHMLYQSTEQLYAVLDDLFARLAAEPGLLDPFTHSNLVIRIRLTQPEGEVLLDGRQPPLEVFFGPRPGRANLDIRMSTDLMHRMWTGQESTRQAFFSGKIHTKGNIMRARKLIDLFLACEQIYPSVAAEHGIGKPDRRE